MATSKQFTRDLKTGAINYEDYRHNVAFWPDREQKLKEFADQTFVGSVPKSAKMGTSNSEDALTWSCFDALRGLSEQSRTPALSHLWALSFAPPPPAGFLNGEIHLGKSYGPSGNQTEVDTSIEGDGILVFVEAKLYSAILAPDLADRRPHNQMAHKLLIGWDLAQKQEKEFYFILLDIAPYQYLNRLKPDANTQDAERMQSSSFEDKWMTACWFTEYIGIRLKHFQVAANNKKRPIFCNTSLEESPHNTRLKELQRLLEPGGKDKDFLAANKMANNMGWWTWSQVYKIVLQAVMNEAVTNASKANIPLGQNT